MRIKTYVFVPWERLYHSNRKQGFTLELEEGRVVIEGFVNEINKHYGYRNKIAVPKAHSIWTKEWISTATLNVSNGSHGNTLTEVDSPFIFRQRNIKFSFRRYILYNTINLLVVPKSRPLRTKFQKSSCRSHENRIVGMGSNSSHQRLRMRHLYLD